MPQLKDGTIVPSQVDVQPKKLPDNVPAGALSNSWRCSNGHILGVVFRDKLHHTKISVPRLMLFRGALQQGEPANHAIPFAKIDGGTVVCGICGEEKKWYPGDDYIEKLKQ